MGKHISLANRLKELRRALGWTQQDLSRASGLTRSYISRLEMGDIALPSSEKLRALAQSLGTSPDDLLQAAGYIDSPSESSDLPDIKVYLRRKYAMQEPRTLQAIETIVNCLQASSKAASASASSPAGPPRDAEQPRTGRSRRSGNNRVSNGATDSVSLNSTPSEHRQRQGTGVDTAARRARKSQARQ